MKQCQNWWNSVNILRHCTDTDTDTGVHDTGTHWHGSPPWLEEKDAEIRKLKEKLEAAGGGGCRPRILTFSTIN